MKRTIKITLNDSVLYDGKIINMPFKDQYVIKKSIDLFDDDDPCIIHKSYIYKEYASDIVNLFEDKTQIEGKDFAEQLDIVDIKGIKGATLTLGE